jgi:hypothetical protein
MSVTHLQLSEDSEVEGSTTVNNKTCWVLPRLGMESINMKLRTVHLLSGNGDRLGIKEERVCHSAQSLCLDCDPDSLGPSYSFFP